MCEAEVPVTLLGAPAPPGQGVTDDDAGVEAGVEVQRDVLSVMTYVDGEATDEAKREMDERSYAATCSQKWVTLWWRLTSCSRPLARCESWTPAPPWMSCPWLAVKDKEEWMTIEALLHTDERNKSTFCMTKCCKYSFSSCSTTKDGVKSRFWVEKRSLQEAEQLPTLMFVFNFVSECAVANTLQWRACHHQHTPKIRWLLERHVDINLSAETPCRWTHYYHRCSYLSCWWSTRMEPQTHVCNSPETGSVLYLHVG